MLKKFIGKSAVCCLAVTMILSSSVTVFAETPTSPAAPPAAENTGAPVFENSSTYKVSALLRREGAQTKSMAGDVMTSDAEIIVDATGGKTVVLNFVPAEIMGQRVHATNFKVYQDGTKNFIENSSFVLGEDNTAICRVPIATVRADGTYNARVYSSIMDSDLDLYLDWSTLKKENDLLNKLKEAIKKAKEYQAKDFMPDTFSDLEKAIKDAEMLAESENPDNAQIQEKTTAIDNAINKLVRVMANPFTSPSTKYYLDVVDEDNVGSKAIIKEAVVTTDIAGTPTATIKFKKYTDFLGDYVINKITLVGRDGQPLDNQQYKVDSEGNGVLTFNMYFFPPNGRFKANVEASNADPKTHDIVFAWDTIRTTADFRELDAAIEKTSKAEMAAYTKASFEVFSAVLEKAKKVSADKTSSQDKINDMLKELSEAYDKLMIAENNGSANTVNLGTSGFNNPYAGGAEGDAMKPWAGSRIMFGKNKMMWRVLDASSNLLVLESDPIEMKFSDKMESTHWDTSVARKTLNEEFFNSSFTDAEKHAIAPTTLETIYMDMSKPEGEQKKTIETTDNVFLLTYDDYKNPAYGFHSDSTRKAAISYWTRNRTGMDFMNMVAAISYLGTPMDWGMMGHLDGFGAIPAIRLDSDAILMTTPAGSSISETLEKVAATTDNTWQLTLKAPNTMVKTSDVTFDGKMLKGKFETDFAGATPTIGIMKGEMKTTSRAAVDNSVLAYYGKLMVADDGTFTANLPEDFNPESDLVFFSAEKDMEDGSGRMAAEPTNLDWNTVKMVEPPADQMNNDDQSSDSNASMDNSQPSKKMMKKDTKKTMTPKTGDNSMLSELFVAMILSLVTLLSSKLLRRNEK